MAHTVTEELPPPSGEASVVLDIGGSHGALVVYASEDMEGGEIEIRRSGRPWDGTHTAIRRRDLRAVVAFAGVFGSLPAGRYELRTRGTGVDQRTEPVAVRPTVVGGEVTELHWPAPQACVGPVAGGAA